MDRPLLLIGPTAVGKSEVALQIAEKIGGEIISVDSMQVYRGLDIGTAKPTLADRQRVIHHLLDVVSVAESFSAADFLTHVQSSLLAIGQRQHIPVFCGGTGLYFRVLLHGLGDWGAPDAALRAQIESTPLEELLAELAQRDPETFARIDRKNPRRVFRAVEILRTVGGPFSPQRTQWRSAREGPTANSLLLGTKPLAIGLSRSTEDLTNRLERRVDRMFQSGLVAETERLLSQGLESNRTAMQAIGYRQVVEYLRGQRSLDETVHLVKQRTRQFAKRQMTWFRQQMSQPWINLDQQENGEAVAQRIIEQYR
jgi:tRNA dimethylallyltransferase